MVILVVILVVGIATDIWLVTKTGRNQLEQEHVRRWRGRGTDAGH